MLQTSLLKHNHRLKHMHSLPLNAVKGTGLWARGKAPVGDCGKSPQELKLFAHFYTK